MKDLNGRTYAKLSDLKPGDRLEADGGFTCINEGEVLTVKKRRHSNELFISCRSKGGHTLDGQLDDVYGKSLIGLYPVP